MHDHAHPEITNANTNSTTTSTTDKIGKGTGKVMLVAKKMPCDYLGEEPQYTNPLKKPVPVSIISSKLGRKKPKGVPHMILGDKEDFEEMEKIYGQLGGGENEGGVENDDGAYHEKEQQALDLQRQAELEQEEMERRAIDSKERQKMERRKWLNKLHIFQRYREVREEHALRNWKRHSIRWQIMERELSKNANKKTEDLLMARLGEYREKLEEQILIEEALELLESRQVNFWSPGLRIGNDLLGLMVTIPLGGTRRIERHVKNEPRHFKIQSKANAYRNSKKLELGPAVAKIDPFFEVSKSGYIEVVGTSVNAANLTEAYLLRLEERTKNISNTTATTTAATSQPGATTAPSKIGTATATSKTGTATTTSKTAVVTDVFAGDTQQTNIGSKHTAGGSPADQQNVKSSSKSPVSQRLSFDSQKVKSNVTERSHTPVTGGAVAISAATGSVPGTAMVATAAETSPETEQIVEKQDMHVGFGLSLDTGPKLVFAANQMMFEVLLNETSSSILTVYNRGSTAVHFEWRQTQRSNLLKVKSIYDPVQRFFFYHKKGVILPGTAFDFPIIFKSANPGLFTELWTLATYPKLAHPNIVTLQGLAIEEDTLAQKRNEIEVLLERRQATTQATEIINSILSNVSDMSIISPSEVKRRVAESEQQQFVMRNSELQLYYDQKIFENFVKLYENIQEALGVSDKTWDKSVHTLCLLANMVTAPELRSSFLARINDLISKCVPPTLGNTFSMRYIISYDIFVDLADHIAEASEGLRKKNGSSNYKISSQVLS